MIDKEKIRDQVGFFVMEIAKTVLGERASNVVSHRLSSEHGIQNLSSREMLLTFSEKIKEIMGEKGAHAVLRQIGREVAKALQKEYPEEDYEKVLEMSSSILGVAEKIYRNEKEIYSHNCVFYPLIKEKGYEAMEHPGCWGCLGFIEAFAVKLEKGARGIKWVERDVPNKKCKFIYIKG